MAKLELTGFDELEKMFERLGKPEEFAIKAVNKAAPVLEKHIKKNVKASSNSDKLARSFVATPTKGNDMGIYSVVRPVGDFKKLKNGKVISNSDLAAQFEYGRKGGYKRADMKRPATTLEVGEGKNHSPWRDKSVNDARKECESIMEKEVYKAVDEVVSK